MTTGIEPILAARTEWLSDLPAYQKDLVDQLAQGRDLAGAAQAWLQAGSPNTAPFGALHGDSILFDKVLDEIHDLLCSADKFQDERASLAQEYGAGKVTFTAGVTAYISPVLGADPTMLTPVVAIILTIISQAGLRAWCELQSERRAGREGGSGPSSVPD